VPDGTSSAGPQSDVLVERRDDGVAVVQLNRPKANALSIGLLETLAASLADLATDTPGSVVLWGGERIFAAGADVKEFSTPQVAGRVSDAFRGATDALAGLGCATVAAICGYALGGGLELAMACDLRVASSTTRLGQPEILLGVIPGGGGTQRLARLVGPSRAKDLVMTGRQLASTEALAWGLVDRVVEPDKVLEEALELAAGFASGPRVAIEAAKRAVDEGLETTLAAGLDIEREAFVSVFETEDAERGIASFVEHGPGKATFVGR